MSDDTRKTLETFVADTKDRVDEVKERAQAAIHAAKADIDSARRDVRDGVTEASKDKV
jgi:hypothetical protein